MGRISLRYRQVKRTHELDGRTWPRVGNSIAKAR